MKHLHLLLLAAPGFLAAQPTPAALSAFDTYSQFVESRLSRQPFSLRALAVDRLTPVRSDFQGALIHHWRGTAFVPRARAGEFERLMSDFSSYPRHFAPQVLSAQLLARRGDHSEVAIRLRQRHVITVVMDTTCDVTVGRIDPMHGYSISRSIRISEIDASGTAVTPAEDHGFLWRLNTFWTWEQRDAGLCLRIESLSLSRSIPHGLGWVIGPYVESIPRESLEFTLNSVINALQNLQHPKGTEE